MAVTGIDWYRRGRERGWVAVSLGAGAPLVEVARDLSALVDALGAEVIAIDMPIGLAEEGPRQSYAIGPRILELAELVDSGAELVEVHPELSFTELAGEPLASSKHGRPGIERRRELLAGAGIDLDRRGSLAPEIDVLDAAAVAWSAARIARGEAVALPPGARLGEPMTIWR